MLASFPSLITRSVNDEGSTLRLLNRRVLVPVCYLVAAHVGQRMTADLIDFATYKRAREARRNPAGNHPIVTELLALSLPPATGDAKRRDECHLKLIINQH